MLSALTALCFLTQLVLLVHSLLSVSVGAQNRTTFVESGATSLSPSSSSPLAPLWGCESPALPDGSLHVVVSTFNADPEQLLPWLWHLGLTNAIIYVYYRIDDLYIQRQYHGIVRLPCGMILNVLPLLPNKGREAAAYLHHIVEHYDNLPLAMLLAHDHGPASRHSLCGPFYRRARAFYRGLREIQEARTREAEGKDAASDKVPRRGDFYRFASMVVTLSSGCIEGWARGCCSAFICSGYRRACPFTSDNCTYSEKTNKGGKRGYRHVYMYQNGMYDSRYENQILGADGALRPVALLRYVGSNHRSVEMWNITHEYPPDVHRHTKERTLQILNDILERYDFTARRRGYFKSCCASLLVRKEAITRWPVELYRDLLTYSMDPAMDYEATKAVSGPGWSLWLDRDYTPQDIMTYTRVW
ncbi:hypothetical protein Vretifemale_9415 [Volvox reticuliferus]|uniref:Uncharacterized protein n=1 Tax=Volvox reticuliferus TaxID=1737510 RepID=A0A8J4FP64_9CHLO|nr:hypothetical protein Vretifemale_9415 [Volvox reticuliferus]